MKLMTCTLCYFLLFYCSGFANSRVEYRYQNTTHKNIFDTILTIESHHHTKKLTWRNEKNETQHISLGTNHKIQNITFFTQDKVLTHDVEFDYINHNVIVKNNDKINVLKLPNNTYAQGALFYLFNYFKPLNKGDSIDIHLLQPKLFRNTKMYLRHIQDETLHIMGKSISVQKYEMGLSDFIMSTFWPYKYSYWYAPELGLVVKYQGTDKDRNEEVVVLTKKEVFHK